MKLVDLLEVRHLILSVDKSDCDIARDAAVAVDVGRRAVRGHRDAARRTEVGAPDVVRKDKTLCKEKNIFLLRLPKKSSINEVTQFWTRSNPLPIVTV